MSAERKNWDKGEWADKARQRDAEAAKHAKARDQAMKEGKLSPHIPHSLSSRCIAQLL
jgi:hypothetical protein